MIIFFIDKGQPCLLLSVFYLIFFLPVFFISCLYQLFNMIKMDRKGASSPFISLSSSYYCILLLSIISPFSVSFVSHQLFFLYFSSFCFLTPLSFIPAFSLPPSVHYILSSHSKNFPPILHLFLHRPFLFSVMLPLFSFHII